MFQELFYFSCDQNLSSCLRNIYIYIRKYIHTRNFMILTVKIVPYKINMYFIHEILIKSFYMKSYLQKTKSKKRKIRILKKYSILIKIV